MQVTDAATENQHDLDIALLDHGCIVQVDGLDVAVIDFCDGFVKVHQILDDGSLDIGKIILRLTHRGNQP